VGKPGPKKIHRYSAEFKLTAVKLSHMPGIEVQTVAHGLDIHPFMLSRWRKEVRDGVLRGRARRVDLPARSARELKQLQALKREHALLQEEHELLKSHPVLFRTKTEIFAFIDTQREPFAVKRLCALYAVTRAGYDAWRQRDPSARQRQDAALLEQIRDHLRPQPRHVWQPPHPSLARRRWRAREATTRRPALAPGRAPGPRPEALSAHAGAARLLHEHPQSPARSLGDGAGPGLGRRHHLSESRWGPALSRRRHGPLLAPNSRLEPQRDQGCPPHATCPEPRCLPSASTARRRLPQRPRRRVRRVRLPRSPRRSGGSCRA
jgi:transposase